MEYLLDTVDLEEIKEGLEHLPVAGLTSNPSIVKKTNPADFFAHMRTIREMLGMERTLHVQVIARDSKTQLEEAEAIFRNIDKNVYVKVPVTWEGLRTIRILKEQGHHVTATAIYDIMQAYDAAAAGADYLAIYVNRMATMGADPYDLISRVEERIAMDGYNCKTLGASYHSTMQVRDSINAGAQAVTVPLTYFRATFGNANIEKAVNDFETDWESMYGKGTNLMTVGK